MAKAWIFRLAVVTEIICTAVRDDLHDLQYVPRGFSSQLTSELICTIRLLQSHSVLFA